MTNATETTRALDRNATATHDVEVRIAELSSRRSDLLTEIPAATSDFRAATLAEELDAIEQELLAARRERGQLADLAEALRAKLPSPAEVAAAEERCEELAATAAEAASESSAAWSDLTAELVAVTAAVARVRLARAHYQQAAAERARLAEQFALSLSGLAPEVPARDALGEVHRLLVRLAQDVLVPARPAAESPPSRPAIRPAAIVDEASDGSVPGERPRGGRWSEAAA